MPEPFITTDHLAAVLRRPAGSLTGDLSAELAVGSACDTLRDLCGQVFDAVIDDVVVLDGSGTDSLILPEWPVHEVTSVKVRSFGTGPDIVVPASAYDLRNGCIRLRTYGSRALYGVWLRGRGVYEVTYSHGYAPPAGSGSGSGGSEFVGLPAMPGTLKILAATMAARIYDQGLVTQETAGSYQVIFQAESALAMTRAERNLVAKYRPTTSNL